MMLAILYFAPQSDCCNAILTYSTDANGGENRALAGTINYNGTLVRTIQSCGEECTGHIYIESTV